MFIPWLPVLRGQPPEATGWMRESVSGSVAGFLSALGGVGRVPGPFGGPPPTALFLAGVAAGIVLLGALAHVAVARGDAEVRRALVFTVLVLGGALCAGAWRPVAFAGRTEMAVLPVWIWGVARAAGESRTSRGGGAAAALFGVAATCAVVLRPAAIPAGDVTAALLATARPADVVVAAGGFYLPLRLEAERGRLPARVRALPREIEAHPGWFVPALPADADARAIERELGRPSGGRPALPRDPAALRDSGAAWAPSGPRAACASWRGAATSSSCSRHGIRIPAKGPPAPDGLGNEPDDGGEPGCRRRRADRPRNRHAFRRRRMVQSARQREHAVGRRGIQRAQSDRPDEVLHARRTARSTGAREREAGSRARAPSRASPEGPRRRPRAGAARRGSAAAARAREGSGFPRRARARAPKAGRRRGRRCPRSCRGPRAYGRNAAANTAYGASTSRVRQAAFLPPLRKEERVKERDVLDEQRERQHRGDSQAARPRGRDSEAALPGGRPRREKERGEEEQDRQPVELPVRAGDQDGDGIGKEEQGASPRFLLVRGRAGAGRCRRSRKVEAASAAI